MTHVHKQDLRDSFYAYGEIRSISVVTKQGCAFVQYTRRASAEVAAEKTFNKLVGKFCVIFPSGLQATAPWAASKLHLG